jgi:HlyD family secretion protein
MIASGSVISGSTSNSSNSVSSQQLGSIKRPDENTQAVVALSELDAGKVSPDQKVTITMDAYPDKTFTGKVLVVNTNGSVSSGVTTYPATIQFDTATGNIYPNMAVTTKIITQIKNDVLMAPSTAIQSTNGTTTLRTLKNGVLTNVPVEVGVSNDTQTEIVSGANEGDTVVTSIIKATTTSTSSTSTSVFGALGGAARGGVGGGAARGFGN